jgi:hypothetical protein
MNFSLSQWNENELSSTFFDHYEIDTIEVEELRNSFSNLLTKKVISGNPWSYETGFLLRWKDFSLLFLYNTVKAELGGEGGNRNQLMVINSTFYETRDSSWSYVIGDTTVISSFTPISSKIRSVEFHLSCFTGMKLEEI